MLGTNFTNAIVVRDGRATTDLRHIVTRVASEAARKAGERRYRSSNGPTTGSTENSASLAPVALIGED